MPKQVPSEAITDAQLIQWGKEWRKGRSKNDIERQELDDPKSHGKYITRLWRERLGVETEDVHPLVWENMRLRNLLEKHGVDPNEEE